MFQKSTSNRNSTQKQPFSIKLSLQFILTQLFEYSSNKKIFLILYLTDRARQIRLAVKQNIDMPNINTMLSKIDFTIFLQIKWQSFNFYQFFQSYGILYQTSQFNCKVIMQNFKNQRNERGDISVFKREYNPEDIRRLIMRHIQANESIQQDLKTFENIRNEKTQNNYDLNQPFIQSLQELDNKLKQAHNSNKKRKGINKKKIQKARKTEEKQQNYQRQIPNNQYFEETESKTEKQSQQRH